MLDDIIITCAVTGAGDGHKINPAVPVHPRDIAREVIAAAQAGAAIAHIHVRDPQTGSYSMELELYREVVGRIRDSGTDIVINLTTGAGARFIPGADDPRLGAPGSSLAHPEARVAHVLDLKPELCSLDVATMNFGQHAMVNTPDHLARMAEMVQAAGVKPELEVFDLGHVRLARDLLARGIIQGKPLFQLCLGIPWGAEADARSLLCLKDNLPDQADWTAFGISKAQYPTVALAAAMGGHVRVGLEDNLYISRGKLAPGNAVLVERAVKLVEQLGANVASPASARRILGLENRIGVKQ